MTTDNKQQRPGFRPLPELEHLADPDMVSLRKTHNPPSYAQIMTRKRSGLIMKLGGICAQLDHVIAEVSNLALEPIETPSADTLRSMQYLLNELNSKLRKQWGYKELRHDKDS